MESREVVIFTDGAFWAESRRGAAAVIIWRWQAGADGRGAGINRGGVRRLEAVAGGGQAGGPELAGDKWTLIGMPVHHTCR